MRYMKCLTLGIALFLAIVSSQSGIAATGTRSYICDYTSWSDDKGLHKDGKPFSLTFVYDPSAKKAYMLGNQGTGEVMVVTNSEGGISFVEVTGTGNVMVTAISRTLQSVHSRHTVFSTDIIPSQYYGKCAVK
jgi:hypothetical protein